MGVHDTDKYPAIKSLLGIPEDEPIFILRGQDALAADTIHHYVILNGVARRGAEVNRREPYPNPEIPQHVWQQEMESVIDAFEDWSNSHTVKLAD